MAADGLFVAGAAAVLAAASSAATPPARVMSINLCADQLVLALAPAARITSVSWLARDADTSPMAAAARRVAVNHGLAEEVVRDRPDLVVAGAYTAPASLALLRRLHYRVLVLQPGDSFDDVSNDIGRVAAAVGEPARGAALAARMRAGLAGLRAAPASNIRAAAWGGDGLSARPGSLEAAILVAAGLRPVADASTRGAEGLLAAAPALLVASGGEEEAAGRRGDLARHPLVRRVWAGRTVRLPLSAYACATPASLDAARVLQAAVAAHAALARTPLPYKPWPPR